MHTHDHATLTLHKYAPCINMSYTHTIHSQIQHSPTHTYIHTHRYPCISQTFYFLIKVLKILETHLYNSSTSFGLSFSFFTIFMDFFFSVSAKKQQSNTKLSFLLAINKCSWTYIFQNARKTNGPRTQMWECLPSLFFLMKLWLFLCLYQAKGRMLGNTCSPSRCLALENTQKMCHKDQERLSSLKAGPAPHPLPAFRSIKTGGRRHGYHAPQPQSGGHIRHH